MLKVTCQVCNLERDQEKVPKLGGTKFSLQILKVTEFESDSVFSLLFLTNLSLHGSRFSGTLRVGFQNFFCRGAGIFDLNHW